MPSSFPTTEFAPTDLLPHRAPMLWVDRVVSVESDAALCQVTLDPASVLVGPLGAPATFAVEILAQAGGIWLKGRPGADGLPLQGMMAVVSKSAYAVTRLPSGECLSARVWPVLSGRQPLHKLAGELRDAAGELLATAEFSIYVHPPT